MTVVAPHRVRSGDRLAFAWGFGEAVLFYVIPDVLLTLVAIRFGFRRSLRVAVIATAGAVLGGLVVYAWASSYPAFLTSAMQLLPGIDQSMIDAVGADVATNGNGALLAGPWQGRPYKLFALASGDLGLSPIALALLTIPGRLTRFAVSVAVASYLRWFFARWMSEKTMIGVWAVFWVLVYVGYWFL